jgi:hypothetical protein
MTSGATSHATCRGTWTRGVGKVVDDEPAQCEVVDDESRDKPCDVPKQTNARRRKIDFDLTGERRLDSMDLDESMSRLILLTRVIRIRPVVMITPT